MAVLSDYVTSSNNLQFASIAVTAVNTDTYTFPIPGATYYRVRFNTIFQNPYNIVTLNPSTSSFTLPTGLYRVDYIFNAVANNTRGAYNRIQRGSTTLVKWPAASIGGDANISGLGQIGDQITSCGLYLSAQSDLSLEQYWDTSLNLRSLIDDGQSNIFYRLDIWKLR